MGILGGIGSLAVAGQQQTFRLGGEIAARIGQEPAAIADRENPPLELTAGVEYEITWENLDGQPHDFRSWTRTGTNSPRRRRCPSGAPRAR
ncbi:hypothetical protein [Halosimplex halophilum]|uniref:hypothetical protein n=1 Tax=Halosimplex halophilum TaxID=2559572 RepID=UPI00107F847E|nr:hypothetical protein [Halosimplex halophilum]